MPEGSGRFVSAVRGSCMFLLVLLAAAPASAHKLKVFATAAGPVISGRVYFRADAPAQAATVQVFGPSGELIERLTTDGQGRFSVVATRRIDHRIVAESGDGHRAEVVVTADELPVSMTERSGPATGGPDSAASVSPAPIGGAASAPSARTAGPPLAVHEVEAIVERAVARQVGPLREQLAAYEDQLRWRDVLGGLGWILGLTGLGAILWPRRRSPAPVKDRSP